MTFTLRRSSRRFRNVQNRRHRRRFLAEGAGLAVCYCLSRCRVQNTSDDEPYILAWLGLAAPISPAGGNFSPQREQGVPGRGRASKPLIRYASTFDLSPSPPPGLRLCQSPSWVRGVREGEPSAQFIFLTLSREKRSLVLVCMHLSVSQLCVRLAFIDNPFQIFGEKQIKAKSNSKVE